MQNTKYKALNSKCQIQNTQLNTKDKMQVKGAEPTAWERKSDKNLQDSQKARAKSERLRAEVLRIVHIVFGNVFGK